MVEQYKSNEEFRKEISSICENLMLEEKLGIN